MAITRNQEHFIVMTVIYDELTDFVMSGGKTFRDVSTLVEGISDVPLSEQSVYVQQTLAYALNHYGEIVQVFEPYLRDWSWSRLPLLTQSVLLMSYAHSKVEDVDKSVIISVAVNLAKKYIEPKQAKFVNGILNEVLK